MEHCARVVACTALLELSSAALAAQPPPRLEGTSRPAAPRLAPLDETGWTDVHRRLVATYAPGRRAGNDLRTLLRYPDVVEGVMPFAAYVTGGSTLPPRDRELLILRTAWLAGSEYAWAAHADAARRAGVDAAAVRRVAEGPRAAGWNAFDATLLRAADELFVNASVVDDTWKALSARYTTQQMIDAVFAVAEFTMLSSMYNSLGLQPDAWLADRLPRDVPRRTTVPAREPPLSTARVPPLGPSEWTPAVRRMLDPQGAGRPVLAIYRTIARHPALYPSRQNLSEYIRLRSALTPRVRETLILRIGWLCRSEYEWAQHVRQGRAAGVDVSAVAAGPDAPGWSVEDAAVLHAADELYFDASISDATWTALRKHFDDRQLIDILITTGGYRMVSMALNALGVQLEPSNERFPR
jgi:4-carboxymuconolactone decarboxylase